MNRQRGVIAVVYLWVAGIVGVLILGLGAGLKIQTSRLESCRTAHEQFVAEVRVQGELAAKEAVRVNLANQKAMEAANGKIKQVLADNDSLGKRLRDARSRSGFLPKPPANSPSPDRACFNRAELESAIGRLDAGVQSLISQGDQAKLRLSTAQEWSKSLAK